jgi:NitT/TauT family transport system ATP-binding protein
MADSFGVTLDHVSFSFGSGGASGNRKKIIDDVSLVLQETPTVILGPSGCGKTTLLRLIAGLLKPESGVIQRVVPQYGTSPHSGGTAYAAAYADGEFNTAFVFQEPRLLPHLSVLENITLPSRKHLPVEELRQKAVRLLALTGLQNEADRYPDALSGGQKQRVSIARAFCYPAPLLLMDEPFQSLDLPLRLSLLETLKNLLAVENRFVAAVTHDPREAVILAKRILVLGKNGRIVFDTINDTRSGSRDPSALEREIIHHLT